MQQKLDLVKTENTAVRAELDSTKKELASSQATLIARIKSREKPLESHPAAAVYLRNSSLETIKTKPKSFRNVQPQRDFSTVLERGEVRVRETTKKQNMIRQSHQQAVRTQNTIEEDSLPKLKSKLRNSSNPQT